MNNTREKLVEMLEKARDRRGKVCQARKDCSECSYRKYEEKCHDYIMADALIANGVTVQDKKEVDVNEVAE